MSNSSSEMEMSESTESALIESMEVQIDAMHDEIQKLHETITKLNKKIKHSKALLKAI